MKSPQALKEHFESNIAEMNAQPAWQGSLYAPIKYIMEMGGKRVRPLLLLLSYQALSGRDAAEAQNCAAAVELFHNFSLLHDDIMDNAPVRRGKATVHEKWDESTAILAGDAMFALSFEYLIRDFPDKAAALIREFSRISVGVCEGQMEDMEMAGAEQSDIPAYLEMIRKKTAMLIGGSMSMGALAAGASAELAGKIYVYGEAVGIGFQLQDDYLDVYAGKEKFGKQIGGDILENKMTYLLLRAIEKASSSQKAELDRLLTAEKNPEAKIAGVMEIYDQLGIRDETRAQIDAYFNKAGELGKELESQAGFEQIDVYLKALMKRDY